ncbi:MAG: hypothetical protein LVR00_07650 [Rhabdochlamydiaceae bacterium]
MAKKTPSSSSEEFEKSLSHPTTFPMKERSDMRIRVSSDPPEKPGPLQRNTALNAQRVYNGDFTTYQIPPPSLLTNPKKSTTPLSKKS